MKNFKKPLPVKLFIGMITQNEKMFIFMTKKLNRYFGKIDFISQIIPFDTTGYYKKELGEDLKRQFISFKELINRENISDIKNKTNKIEKKFSIMKEGKIIRQINIDPGYLTLASVILVTTKDYSHRIYLKDGIYAEVTLCYKNNSFIFNEWTYPDYRKQEYLKVFYQLREKYFEQLQKEKKYAGRNR